MSVSCLVAGREGIKTSIKFDDGEASDDDGDDDDNGVDR